MYEVFQNSKDPAYRLIKPAESSLPKGAANEWRFVGSIVNLSSEAKGQIEEQGHYTYKTRPTLNETDVHELQLPISSKRL